MPIEIESPEERGYDQVKYNLTESSAHDFSVTPELINTLEDLKKMLEMYGK